eukprot:4820653-Pleurochrysis_carterae.AAC.4
MYRHSSQGLFYTPFLSNPRGGTRSACFLVTVNLHPPIHCSRSTQACGLVVAHSSYLTCVSVGRGADGGDDSDGPSEDRGARPLRRLHARRVARRAAQGAATRADARADAAALTGMPVLSASASCTRRAQPSFTVRRCCGCGAGNAAGCVTRWAFRRVD